MATLSSDSQLTSTAKSADSPVISLVSQPLKGDNYDFWSHGMIIALLVKNKLGFIDGSISKLDGSDLNLLRSWIRNNFIVISWIINAVSKQISKSIMFSLSFDSVSYIYHYRFDLYLVLLGINYW